MPVLRTFVGKVREAGGAIAQQIEFPLRVAVCAWCRPHPERLGGEPISHGICPRHMRELQLELKGIFPVRRPPRRKSPDPPAGELLFAFFRSDAPVPTG